ICSLVSPCGLCSSTLWCRGRHRTSIGSACTVCSPSCATGSGLVHPHQVDHEDQRLVGADRPGGAGLSVGQVRRNLEAATAALFHADQALVPALDDLSDAGGEVQRLAAVPGGVELLAGGPGDAHIVTGDLVAGDHFGPGAGDNVLDDQILWKRAFGEVDFRAGAVVVGLSETHSDPSCSVS